ncbi:NADH-dependent flavin oxidoreductase [Clostridium estertheticum]|uniref:NADH-dependent flavin oxidoreductase n=1 Tax=Clostridium estertheticum TaxID=238834 RepID=UPI001C0B0365|nr:NADH-dependent flavin oxidoreductase [Clostridium estertheticum]MBU3185913.1 NADH-dependent flavin oxidoreductase [Clostridium estertheticum]MCB2342199.1 NADH-dependent flavin oxidoreductase [Clostridium estertheticum]
MKIENLLKQRTLDSTINVKNPIVMAPMTTFSANPDGTVSVAELSYYKARSKGVGIVITAATNVQKSGKGFPGQFAAYNNSFLPSLKKLSQTIKGEGALAILQIFHGGRMAIPAEIPGGQTISASAIAAEREGAMTPREMTEAEIQDTINAFGETTKLAIAAGFDGVEIHGANTYLLQQFFSPHSNRRDDMWGGSLEKRMNFPLAVIAQVKKVIKEDGIKNFIVGYRFSPEELENPGITLDDTLSFIDVLSNQGLSYLHSSISNFWQSSIRNASSTNPIICSMLDKIHDRVPFIGVGSIHTPEDAIKALNSGATFISLGRELIMEPDWVSKVQTGDFSKIRTTLNKTQRKSLDIPEPLWNTIINTPGWFPMSK